MLVERVVWRPRITVWEPNQVATRESGGERRARRNLLASLLAEVTGATVWQLWDIVAVVLPLAGFPLTVAERFWLAGIPALVGSLLRLPYGAMVALVGGRTWTAISAALLFVDDLTVSRDTLAHHDFPLFFLAFMVLFVTSGIGNGPTFQMVYPLFLSDDRPAVVAGRVTPEEAVARSRRHAAAAMAVGSAVGALGGFLVPVGFAQSSQATHSPAWAMAGFTLFYVLCAATTVVAYLRSPRQWRAL